MQNSSAIREASKRVLNDLRAISTDALNDILTKKDGQIGKLLREFSGFEQEYKLNETQLISFTTDIDQEVTCTLDHCAADYGVNYEKQEELLWGLAA